MNFPQGLEIGEKLLWKYEKNTAPGFIRLDPNLIIDKYTTNNANFFADIS